MFIYKYICIYKYITGLIGLGCLSDFTVFSVFSGLVVLFLYCGQAKRFGARLLIPNNQNQILVVPLVSPGKHAYPFCAFVLRTSHT